MRVQIGFLLLCLVLFFSAINADREDETVLQLAEQIVDWAGQECEISNQKLLNRELGFETCNDFCKGITQTPECWSGVCQLHDGDGECQCIFTPTAITTSF